MKHGRTGYNRGCRCDTCMSANRAYGKVAKQRYYGLSDQTCACGCGQRTGLAFGKPKRFVYHHQFNRVRERIMANVMPEPNTGCWLWMGALTNGGYGIMTKRSRRVHRVLFEIANGPIPKGMLCCHRCDTPACVNPDHIFLGTHKDNSDDKVKKGRHRRVPKTHCIRGHAMTGDNVRITTAGYRRCHSCSQIRDRTAKAKKLRPTPEETRAAKSRAAIRMWETRRAG